MAEVAVGGFGSKSEAQKLFDGCLAFLTKHELAEKIYCGKNGLPIPGDAGFQPRNGSVNATPMFTSNGSETVCAGCKKEADDGKKFSVCAKCKREWYCGRDCQAQQSKEHKKVCKMLAAGV